MYASLLVSRIEQSGFIKGFPFFHKAIPRVRPAAHHTPVPTHTTQHLQSPLTLALLTLSRLQVLNAHPCMRPDAEERKIGTRDRREAIKEQLAGLQQRIAAETKSAVRFFYVDTKRLFRSGKGAVIGRHHKTECTAVPCRPFCNFHRHPPRPSAPAVSHALLRTLLVNSGFPKDFSDTVINSFYKDVSMQVNVAWHRY